MKLNYIEKFHQYFNITCDYIKFTREEKHEGSLAFLDVLVARTLEGPLQTTVFRKPKHTGRCQHFCSHYPLQQILSIHQTLSSRAENIIKEDELKKDEILTINNTLITNEYPRFYRKRRLLALKVKTNKRKSWMWYPTCRTSPNLLSALCSKLVWGGLWSLFVSCLIFFVNPKTKFWTKKSWALFIKYLSRLRWSVHQWNRPKRKN